MMTSRLAVGPSARNGRRLTHLLRRFVSDERGVAAVEFGLLALPFLAVLTGLFEIAYVNFTSSALQNAVTVASRDIMTGNLQSQGISTAAQFITQKICPNVSNTISNVDCTKLIVDMRTASAFTGIDMTNDIYTGTNLKYCPGGPGQITVVRVTYPLASIFPISLYNRFVGLVNDVPGGGGTYYHIVLGSALFQTEPYTYAYTPPATC